MSEEQDRGDSADADRATLASPQAPAGLGHAESVPSAGMRQEFPFYWGKVSRGHSLNAHPADGTVAHVDCGGGATMSICDPTAETSLEWTMRYGNPEEVRFTVASILASYDYLVRGCHSTREAQRRVALLRRATTRLWHEGPLPTRPAQGMSAETPPKEPT